MRETHLLTFTLFHTLGAADGALTCTRPLVRLEGVPGVTPAYRAVLRVLAVVLAASVAMVASH